MNIIKYLHQIVNVQLTNDVILYVFAWASKNSHINVLNYLHYDMGISIPDMNRYSEACEVNWIKNPHIYGWHIYHLNSNKIKNALSLFAFFIFYKNVG